MTIFNFNSYQDFTKAQEILINAIDKISSTHFDHSVQLSEQTITIINEKDAIIIDSLLKQNNIIPTKHNYQNDGYNMLMSSLGLGYGNSQKQGNS
jgi:predicted transcriptional regulator